MPNRKTISCFMLTIAVGRIRQMPRPPNLNPNLLYLTHWVRRNQLFYHSCLKVTQSFAPDRHFGLIKKAYRKTRVDNVGCIARLVEQSLVIGANLAQLVHNSKGERVAHSYEWSWFLLQYFKTIPEITSYLVFRFDHLHPGTVFVFTSIHNHLRKVSPYWKELIMIEETILLRFYQKVFHWYLYEKILSFCSSNLLAGITCPKPLLPKPSDNPSIGASSISNTVNSAGTKRRQCSLCKGEGHTKRTCRNSVV